MIVTSSKAEPAELAEDDLDDRHRVGVAQRHQRLGQDVGVRPQPRSLASRQQYGLHRIVPSWLSCDIVVDPDGRCLPTCLDRLRIDRSAARSDRALLLLANEATRRDLGRGDLLEDRDQPRDVHVERLLAARAVAPAPTSLAVSCRRPCGRARRSARRVRSGDVRT